MYNVILRNQSEEPLSHSAILDTNFANVANITFIDFDKEVIFSSDDKFKLMSNEAYNIVERDDNIVKYSKLDRDTLKYVNIII